MNMMSMAAPWFGAHRLWLDNQVSRINVFMAVRRKFTVEKALHDVIFRIMADSDFIAYMDGQEIGRGQFSDDPDAPTYTDIILDDLSAGEHLLAVSVYHKGYNCSVYAAGLPGVVFALLSAGEAVLVSDKTCKVLPTPGFRSGDMPLLTPQLGFTMEFDARLDMCDWRQMDYDDSSWQVAYAELETRQIELRPAAARPVMEALVLAKRIRSGWVTRRTEQESTAMTMAVDQVFWHRNTEEGVLERLSEVSRGWSLIYDLGEEKVGFVEFELEAPAGTIVDFAHGEHLDDGHVRMECFGRNFADRYICRGSGDHFQLPFRRIGGRYIEFHIIAPDDCSKLDFKLAGIAPWTLPLPPSAGFAVADDQLMLIRKLAIRTLEHCMHEHYEDCPWREQALYTYDSRNQMLYGYYIWGNYGFAAASLNLIGMGLREDGFLRLCHPSRMSVTIPIFSMIWPLQIYEHWLYSGDASVWHKQKERVYTMYRKISAIRDENTELYQALNQDYWNFYEWTPGLGHTVMGKDDVHSLYNLYLANMIEAMAQMEKLDGNEAAFTELQTEAERIRCTVEKLFYVEGENCYASFMHNNELTSDRHEHVQLMMLFAGAVPENRRAGVVKRLVSAESLLTPVTLSAMPYLMQAMIKYDYGVEARCFIRKKLEKDYYPMLDGHSTTLWETAKGGDDFVFAGSLCHGWSSLPIYYCAAGLLGVIPLEIGFKRFRVRPWADGRDSAAGEIPTPAGMIRIAWQKNDQNKYDLEVRYPEALTPVIEELSDTPLGEVKLIGC